MAHPPPSLDTLTGVLERIMFLNEENHYTIAEFRPDKPDSEKVTIVGPLPGAQCGETLHLRGQWTKHAQHGSQFKVDSFKAELPSSVYGIRKYLGSGLVPGIGKVYANKIVDAFGTDTFRVLSEESARLRNVPGIGKVRVNAIKKAWDDQRALREIHIFLQTYGVTTGQCVKLVHRYGNEAKQILLKEPYRVAREIDGIGFKTADRIAINLGFANDAAPRLDAGLLFAMETLQEEGHTAITESDLTDYATQLLETMADRVTARIAALVEAKQLVRHSTPPTPSPSTIHHRPSTLPSPSAPARTPPPTTNYKLPTTSATGPTPPPSTIHSLPSTHPSASAPALQLPTSNLNSPAVAAAGLNPLLQLPVLDRAEERIATALARLLRVASGLPPIKIDAAVKWAEDKAGFEFAEKQRAALRSALGHKVSVLTGGPGTGKAQPLRAPVLTPTGFRPIGDLKLGDAIVSAEGAISQVTGVHPQGAKPVFRVDFVDGRACECCADHLWRIWTRTSVWSPARKKKIRSRGWRVVPLSYLQRRMKDGRTENDRMAVPLIAPCAAIPNATIPIDPYVLGALIGDGGLRDTVILTNTDPALLERIAARIAPLGLRLNCVTLRNEPTISWRIVGQGRGFANPLRAAIKSLGLAVHAWKKFIPPAYFSGSVAQRLELLRGLLDTDGTVDRLGVVSFSTTSQQLASDFQRLAWSLGCIATIGTLKNPTFTYRGERKNGRTVYNVFLQHPDPATLFTLPRKIQRTKRLRPRKRLGHRLRIAAITPMGDAECVCISIGSPSGLYVTSDYVVTHNTTCLRALVEILKAKKIRVHLAAPTGRAAQRLAETTGGFASTIHRLLKYDPVKGGFTANESTPLATDFLIVDEASMLDTRLAAALFQAVPSRAHFLLVGDTDQLPSVGAGNVLKDIIATAPSASTSASASGSQLSTLSSQLSARSSASVPSTFNSQLSTAVSPALPVTRLDVIYRQQGQSQIVTTAHAINAGDPSLPPATADLAAIQAWSDLTFVVADSAEDCVAKVLALCTEFIPRHWHWFNPVRDVQILAPMHKGVAGVGNLNLQLQATLNPHAKGLRGPTGEFRPGDKIIQLRNNYDKNLFNGDIGAVTAIDAEAGTLEANFDGEKHTFDRGEFGNLALAYSVSIHKSQGSEYPVVIVPLLKAHFMMLQRNLIYTAITRGRKKVFIVGEPAAYAMAVRNSESKTRSTHLRQKIAAASAAAPLRWVEARSD